MFTCSYISLKKYGFRSLIYYKDADLILIEVPTLAEQCGTILSTRMFRKASTDSKSTAVSVIQSSRKLTIDAVTHNRTVCQHDTKQSESVSPWNFVAEQAAGSNRPISKI